MRSEKHIPPDTKERKTNDEKTFSLEPSDLADECTETTRAIPSWRPRPPMDKKIAMTARDSEYNPYSSGVVTRIMAQR